MTKEESVFDRPLEIEHNEPAKSVDWQKFMDVVSSRRSVRVYEPTPINEADVRDCLQAALLAPNSSNLQPWEFYWVRTPEKKAALVKACLSQPAAATAAELIVCVAHPKAWRANRERMLDLLQTNGAAPAAVLSYYKKLVPLVYNQGPLGIFGLAKKIGVFFAGFTRPLPREPFSHGEMRTWASKSTALACENLMLAFRAKGLDSCPMEGLDANRVRKLLGLSSDADIVMVVSAGRRAKNGVYGPQIRFDSNLFIREV